MAVEDRLRRLGETIGEADCNDMLLCLEAGDGAVSFDQRDEREAESEGVVRFSRWELDRHGATNGTCGRGTSASS